MTYTVITNAEIAPGAPLSTALMTALRDNAAPQFGRDQTWQDVSGSRSANTVYQNTTGVPIMVAITDNDFASKTLQVSSDNVTFITVGSIIRVGSDPASASTVVAPDHYYRFTGTASTWAELR